MSLNSALPLQRARELDDTDPDSRAAYAMFLLRFRRLPAAAAALAKAGTAIEP